MKQPKIEIRPISELKNWENNPRDITAEGYERLKRQIEELDIYKPLLIHEDGTVLGGNMRLRAFREMGVTEVTVSVVNAPTEEMKIKYALSDNDQVGKTDKNMLVELISQYPDLDIGNYAVHLIEPETLTDFMAQFKEVEEDEAPEVEEGEPKSKLGEVYQLGKHRLMCGDATKIEDVEKLMDGKKAYMVFTDPPYNIDYEGKTKKRLKIQNDKFEGNGFYDFLLDAFKNTCAVQIAGGAIYICHADMERITFQQAMKDAGYLQKQNIIWVKDSIVLGRQDYHWRHEPILYGWKDGDAHKWHSDRKQETVWEIKRPTRSEEHPTMKPVALMVIGIKNSSRIDDIVLDTFLGSGSTLIACEQTGRICYGMELDPKYADVCRKRYAKFIGKEGEWETVTPHVSNG